MAALNRRTPFTIPGDGANHVLAIQDGVNGGTFWASSSDMFEPVSRTLFGVPTFGVRCKTPGTYRLDGNMFASGLAAARKLTFYHADFGGTLSFNQLGRTALVGGDVWDRGTAAGTVHISWSEWESADAASLPLDIYLTGIYGAGGGTVTIVDIAIYVSYVADLELPAGTPF